MREVESLRDQNEGLREQLEFLKGGEDGLRRYTDAKLAKAIAEKENQAAMLENAGAAQAMIDAIRDQAKALRERQDILAATKIAEQIKKEQQAIDDFLSQTFDHAASALLDFIEGTKSAKDAFRSLARSIEQDLNRLAVTTLQDALFGKSSGAGGVLNWLFGGFNIGSLFPGGGGGGGVPGVAFSDSVTALNESMAAYLTAYREVIERTPRVVGAEA